MQRLGQGKQLPVRLSARPTGNQTSVNELSGRSVQWSYDGIYHLTGRNRVQAPTAKNGTISYGLDPVCNSDLRQHFMTSGLRTLALCTPSDQNLLVADLRVATILERLTLGRVSTQGHPTYSLSISSTDVKSFHSKAPPCGAAARFDNGSTDPIDVLIGTNGNWYCDICDPFQYATSIMNDPAQRHAHIKDAVDFFDELG